MADGATRADAAGADAFTALGETVREALSDRGFQTPTEPQRRAIPPLAAGKNVLVIAPTGTGKTETAMLPVFDALVADRPAGIGALYVTPLRALNRDMRERLEWWGERLDLDVQVRHGDTSDYQRRKQAEEPPDVLITTPETVQAILTGTRLREALADVEHVVIDEVHELAASKRGAQLTVGLERLRDLAGPFQRIGLSATVGDPDAVGQFLVGVGGVLDGRDGGRDGGHDGSRDDHAGGVRGDRSFETVEIDVGGRLSVQVRRPTVTEADEHLAGELATSAEMASHVRVIREIIHDHESTLVFVNTRQTAEALGSRFKALDEPVGVHHGSLSKSARIEVEDQFKAGDVDALICTSSMELGIDVGRVDHVVQYGSPREVARLLQRVGRAGHRRDLVSEGTVIATHDDDALEAMVIARRARDGQVEPVEIHHGSLDVVANQIVGIVMDTGEVSARKAYELVTAAAPFRNLDPETFRAVVRELDGNRIVWLDEDADRIESTGGTWQYFYANLSMIPDEETYEVRDVSARRQIGTLDERFVINFAAPGETFVQRGEMWRIERIDDDENRVEATPVEDPAGEVPSWVGQEIPVPAAVAQEVGDLREVTGSHLADDASREAVGCDLATRYPVDEDTAAGAIAQVERQVETGVPMPTDERIVIESQGRTIVLNAAFGHEINRTLGRLCCALLGQQAGSSVGMDVDPYRIELEVPQSIRPADVIEILESTDPDHLPELLELALKNSEGLKFTLTHVAAKFGALNRDRGDRFGADRLFAALEGTPVFEEAVREVFHTELAVEAATDVLDSIQSGDRSIEVARERTPIGTGGRSSGRELVVPENADASVLAAIRDRIQNDRVLLFCLHCQEFERERRVGRVADQPECPECESTRIAALNPWDEETVAAVRATDKDDEQERRTRRAYRSANLVQSHGKQAVIAMAARGVGPHNAARIIANFRADEDEFYRDLLEQERQYARTKSFWD